MPFSITRRDLLVFLVALVASTLVWSYWDFFGYSKLDLAANAISEAADKCLLDVRDKKIKYETSPNCNSLSALMTQYIEAGGMQTETPCRYELKYQSARAVAWSALATSNDIESGSGLLLSIW